MDDTTNPGGGNPAWNPGVPPVQPDPTQVPPAEPTVPTPPPVNPGVPPVQPDPTQVPPAEPTVPTPPPADPGVGGGNPVQPGGWTPPGGGQGTNQGGAI